MAGFVAARREGGPAAAPRSRGSVLARTATVKVLTGLALLLVGGTAVAAETNSLPAAAQHHAHKWFSRLGVPPPETPAPTAGPAPGTEVSSRRPSPSMGLNSASGPPGPGSPAPVNPDTVSLCRQWQAVDDKKQDRMPADARRRLLVLAGGDEARIRGFCDPLLTPAATTPAPTPPASPGTTGPGNGNGNGPGGGKGPGPSSGPSKDPGPGKDKNKPKDSTGPAGPSVPE